MHAQTEENPYFGTDGIRGKVGSQCIHPEFLLKLGWAAGTVLNSHRDGKVLVGKDTRISGYMLESALEAGLSAAGVNIHLLGPMPTPAIAYLTRTFRAQVGIVISASHNLYSDNGIKFFSSEGLKISTAVEQAITKKLAEPMVLAHPSQLGKAVRIDDAAGRYIEFCKSTFPTAFDLSGLKIVIDCAQGATYHVAPYVFQELGAKVFPLFVHPDGFNINADCGSTHPETLQKKVRENNADLGIAFDGDGDRVVMVDHIGNVVDGDELLFILAKHYKKRGLLRGGVVGTLMTNLGFERAMADLSIEFVRAAVGDRHVIAKLQNLGWHLGGEESGHIVNLDITTTGDGIISALQVLSIMCQDGQDLCTLKSGMQKVPSCLINVPTTRPSVSLETCAPLRNFVAKIQKELGTQGRVLLRPSGTEPIIRVMVEGFCRTQVDKIAQALAHEVSKCAFEL